MSYQDEFIARKYAETAAKHADEHARAERLDGAVPLVVCTGCDERFGYHVGHVGDWRTCEVGWCATVRPLPQRYSTVVA